MRKLIFIIILIIPTQFFGQKNFITWLETNFYGPYIQAGDYFYDQGTYDSALLMYSIPYFLISGYQQEDTTTSFDYDSKTVHLYYSWTELNLKLGKVYFYLGEYNKSKTFLKMLEGLDWHSSPHLLFEGSYNYYLGLVLSRLYDYENSLFHYFKSLGCFKKNYNDSSYFIGLIYCDIGNVYYNLTNYDKAVEYYKISKHILYNQSIPDYSKISIIINNIGSIYYRQGEYQLAIDYYIEAIQMQHNSNVDYFDLSMYLNNVAGIYLLIHEADSAEKYYHKSLRIRLNNLNNNNLLVQSYNQLGLLNSINENYHTSLNFLQKAIVLNTFGFKDTSIFSNPDPHQVLDYRLLGISLYYKAIALYKISLSKDNNNLKYLSSSFSTFELLFKYFEYIYINQVNEGNFEYFAAFNREVLNAAIDIFFNEQALSNDQLFSLIEKGKSIFLYQSFIESKAKEFAKVPKHLIFEEKEIRREINQYDVNILIAQNESLDIINPEEFISIISKRNRCIKKLDSLINVFENEYPQYYQLKYDFVSVPIEAIQKELDDKEAILEYYFSDSVLYTVLISKHSLKIYHQKPDSIIEISNNHIRGIKFYNNHVVCSTGKYLYNVLIKPIEEFLVDISKVVIIPDLSLSSFPFETLIRPNSLVGDSPHYLIIDFDIIYHFSSSLWYKNKIYEITNSRFSTVRLLAYAPVFYPENNYILDKEVSLAYLPHSETEIKAIETLFNSENLEVLALYHEQATKESFLNNVSDYSIIHLATHGIYYKDHPELSGIILYNNIKTTDHFYHSSTKEIDLLHVDETYNLSINANLVVLNACMTGAGRDLRGEGLITLYRGFFYAGAQNILYSLWNIPDLHASIFMRTFYNYIFCGNSYASALKKTKLLFLENERTSLPIFWSNYLILGN